MKEAFQESHQELQYLLSTIDKAVRQILEFEDVSDSSSALTLNEYMFVYSQIYSICEKSKHCVLKKGGVQFMGRDLFEELRKSLIRHLQVTLARIQPKDDSREEEELLLDNYYREWKRYLEAARCIDHLFHYLNRHWIPRAISAGEPHIYYIFVLARVCWRDCIFMKLQKSLERTLLMMINRERLGETINSDLLRGIIFSYGRIV
jgi:cullin 1